MEGFTDFDADRLPAAEIERLKRKEQEGRDAGAASYLARIRERGAYRILAEDLTLALHVAPRPADRVLDAGAGVGRHALRIAPRVARLVCTDFSAEALKVLDSDARRMGLDNVETRVGDVCALDDDLGPFDTVYSSEVLQHIPSDAERLKAMQGMRRVLAPSGRCVVNVLCWNRRVRGPKDGFWERGGGYCHYFTPRELRDLYARAGFRRVSVHGLLLLPGALARRLPVGVARIEPWLSHLQSVAGLARYIVGVGHA